MRWFEYKEYVIDLSEVTWIYGDQLAYGDTHLSVTFKSGKSIALMGDAAVKFRDAFLAYRALHP